MILLQRHFLLMTAVIIGLLALILLKPLLLMTTLVAVTVCIVSYGLWQHPELGRLVSKVLAELIGLIITLSFFMGLLVLTNYVFQT